VENWIDSYFESFAKTNAGTGQSQALARRSETKDIRSILRIPLLTVCLPSRNYCQKLRFGYNATGVFDRRL